MRKRPPHELDRPDPEALERLSRHPLVLVLDNIRSAHNVGSMFRTADAVRAERVICCGYTPTPDHRAVAKTALGAEQTVPWSAEEDVTALLDRLRAAGHTLAALEQTDRPTPLRAVQAEHFPLALVLGNEVEGVQQAVLDRCDLALEIPQYGAKHSLNVAVAFGVAAYALVERLTG
ncbi:MAG: RNA methyltransferase [Rhodothermales bacterium]|nr:RNA methyltransferase [Rhodothermales bacterium]